MFTEICNGPSFKTEKQISSYRMNEIFLWNKSTWTRPFRLTIESTIFFSILVINHCIEFDMQRNTCTVPHAVSTVIIICYRMWELSETQSATFYCLENEQGGIVSSLWCHFQFAIVFVGWSYNLLSCFMHFCFGEVNALYVCLSVCSQNDLNVCKVLCCISCSFHHHTVCIILPTNLLIKDICLNTL